MTMLLVCSHFFSQAQSGFQPSLVFNKHFPKPVDTTAIPTSISPALTKTFYDKRETGSCYNQTFDYDGDGVLDNVYVWAINFKDVIGYSNSVAYEVIPLGTDTIKYRGCKYIGSDIVNLQVGIRIENGQNLLIVAYCEPYGFYSQIVVKELAMSVPDTVHTYSGLKVVKTDTLYTSPTYRTTNQSLNVSLDCSDMRSFVLAWDDPGQPIHLIAYDSSASSYTPVYVLGGSTGLSRQPDVALSRQNGGILIAHIVYVDSTSPTATIYKHTVDVGSLFSPIPTMFLEDVNPLPNAYGGDWDDFQLKIDAPDHYDGTQAHWAYTYFSDYNNTINVRMYNSAMIPVYNTYTVNDGSLPSPSGTPLKNLTSAGNAFPSIAYNDDAQGVYVAWFTTYDPTIPAPMNNALYHYTLESQGYISVYLKDNGNLGVDDYNRVDQHFHLNRIGNGINPLSPYTNMYYPKIAFSKHNEGEKLLTIFSSHHYLDQLIWNESGMGTTFWGEYGETDTATKLYSNSIKYFLAGINYKYATTFSGTSAFLSQKQVKWFHGTPMFRQSQNTMNESAEAFAINLSPNPFTNHINIISNSKEIEIQCYDILGKCLLNTKGKVQEVNMVLNNALSTWASGTYNFICTHSYNKVQQLKLTKL